MCLIIEHIWDPTVFDVFDILEDSFLKTNSFIPNKDTESRMSTLYPLAVVTPNRNFLKNTSRLRGSICLSETFQEIKQILR